MSAATILIVEDEGDLSAIMADYVIAAGYRAVVVADGAEALASVPRIAPDLIVLDLMLPGLDGVSLCRALRESSDTPVIMVTARVEEVDRLLGLETGADDYLCKPFSPRELVARIKAVLRRYRKPDGAEDSQLLELDEARQTIRILSQPLELTTTEYRLLAAMAKHPGAIYTRAQLLDLVSRDSLETSDRAIDSHVKNLRRKIAAILPDTDVIQAVYGLGYRVELPVR